MQLCIYIYILLPRHEGMYPNIQITSYPLLYNSLIIIPVSTTKAIHFHHWLLFSILLLFYRFIHLSIIGFACGLIIQGLSYNDAFNIIIKNPY